jgi:hypothetical protein
MTVTWTGSVQMTPAPTQQPSLRGCFCGVAQAQRVVFDLQLEHLEALHLHRAHVHSLVAALQLMQLGIAHVVLALQPLQRIRQPLRHVLRLGTLDAANRHDLPPVVAHLLLPAARAAGADEHGASLRLLPQRPSPAHPLPLEAVRRLRVRTPLTRDKLAHRVLVWCKHKL